MSVATETDAPLPSSTEQEELNASPDRRGDHGKQAPLTRSLAQHASIVALAFIVSRILGLVREVILAYRFGTSGEYDAYLAAFRVPDLLFLIIMAGSFGAAFIPIFSGLLSRGETDRAWSLASVVLTMAAITMTLTAIIAFVFAGPLVRYVVAPGLQPEYQRIATSTMRILLLSPVFLGLGIAAKGILEAQDLFTLPALAPIAYNLAIIAGAIILAPTYGVYGVAASVAVGAVGHLAVQTPGLIRSGLRFHPSLDLRTAGLSQVGRLLLPRVIGQAAFQINFIAVTWFASRVGEGRVAALNYAWQLLMLPHGVVALSISTVIFPTMARQYDRGDIGALRQTVGQAVRPLLFLTFPASVLLFLLRVPIVQTLFQSGAFSGQSTKLVADPLALLAMGLGSYALVEVLTRAFYAMHDTRTPVIAGIIIIVANIGLSALFVGRWGHTALAMSLSLTTTYEALILLFVLRNRLGGVRLRELGWLGRLLAATAAMAVVTWAISIPLIDATEPGVAPRLVQLGLFGFGLGVAAGSFLFACAVFNVPELPQAARQITSRLPAVARLAASMKRSH